MRWGRGEGIVIQWVKKTRRRRAAEETLSLHKTKAGDYFQKVLGRKYVWDGSEIKMIASRTDFKGAFIHGRWTKKLSRGGWT